jgi:hypothetical protein
MIAFLVTALNFIFLSWIFWPIFIIFSFCSYNLVKSSKHEFAWAPLILIGVVGFGAVWRWPILKVMFTSWQLIGLAIGAYIVAGFIVSLYKYIAELHDFKKDAPEHIARGVMGCDLESQMDLPRDSVKQDGAKVYLNWKAFPHALWWTYWPLFVFSVILDPLTRFIDWAIGFLKTFYQSLAKKFSVDIGAK